MDKVDLGGDRWATIPCEVTVKHGEDAQWLAAHWQTSEDVPERQKQSRANLALLIVCVGAWGGVEVDWPDLDDDITEALDAAETRYQSLRRGMGPKTLAPLTRCILERTQPDEKLEGNSGTPSA